MTTFARDRTSGSTSVASRFLNELERWTTLDRSATAVELRVSLLAWLRAAQAAQPTMALVHQLSARALAVADAGVQRGDAPAELRAHVAQSCRSERDDLAAATASAARMAAATVTQSQAWIATLSSSDAVTGALLELHRQGRRPRVLIAESRPKLEGRSAATVLAAAGLPVWMVADAALPMLVPQAAAVWIGADAVTEHGVINKVGSYVAALAAREHGVPVWSLAVRRKLIPSQTGALSIVEMPADELWDAPPEGVRPRNVYFELVPVSLLRGVIVEDAALGASELGLAARDRALPAELAGAVQLG